MTLSVKQRTAQAGPPEYQLGALTRAFDDPRETDRQQNIVFAVDCQQYWVSFFSQPFLIADVSRLHGAQKGIDQNRILVLEVPGEYTATIELFDETTRSQATAEFRFSVIRNRDH
jgi:hypothetical protein